MHLYSRRGFLASILGTSAGFLGGFVLGRHSDAASPKDAIPAAATPVTSGASASFLNRPYRIFTSGRQGDRHPDSPSTYNKNFSVFTELNTASGIFRQLVLPIYSGHGILPVPALSALLVISQKGSVSALVDNNMEHYTLLKTPAGYMFSGHGIMLDDNRAALTITPKKRKDHSIIAVYDLKNNEVVKQIDSKGTGPHDMVLLPDGKTIAIAYHGHYNDETSDEKTYGKRAAAGSVGLFDTQTQEVTDLLPIESGIPMVHLTADPKGKIFCVSNDYYHDSAGNNVADKLRRDYPNRTWPLHYLEYGEGVVKPLPITEIDLAARTSKERMAAPEFHRRSQSVMYHTQADLIIANYAFSNVLAILKPGEATPRIINSPQLGINTPMALAEIPGTPYFAVGGLMDDIAIVDSRTMQTQAVFRAPLYRCSHFAVLPA